ncbi:glycosyltransferase family 4 protein [Poriferisphaera corsica]|nr:glycosyltransferase family 4 protein [Poriferisphaera corsica]
MKICLFTPNFYPEVGGAERDVDLLAIELGKRGHEVVVLAGKSKGEMPEFSYEVIQYLRPPKQNMWPEVLVWPLLKAHRRHRFDVVLSFYAYPNGYAANLFRRLSGVPVLTTPRGGDLYPNYHGLKKMRVSGVIKRGYEGADAIVSISDWLTGRLHEVMDKPWPRIETVYNGIDLDELDRMRELVKEHEPEFLEEIGGRKFILHLARVAAVKRPELAVRGVSKMREMFEKEGLVYLMVGDGGAFESTKRLIDELGVGDLVKMLGTRVGLDKAWLYENAEFFVSTSREEGFGNVTIEAMSHGLPMLGSRIGPHEELIERYGWGRIFESGSVDDFCEKLGEMCYADLDAMSEIAMSTREQFVFEKMVDGYEQVLFDVVEGAKGNRSVERRALEIK